MLSPLQLAYQPFFSTKTAFLKVFSDIMSAADQGKLTLLGVFDFSTAFDTVDHVTLLDILHISIDISGTALS